MVLTALIALLIVCAAAPALGDGHHDDASLCAANSLAANPCAAQYRASVLAGGCGECLPGTVRTHEAACVPLNGLSAEGTGSHGDFKAYPMPAQKGETTAASPLEGFLYNASTLAECMEYYHGGRNSVVALQYYAAAEVCALYTTTDMTKYVLRTSTDDAYSFRKVAGFCRYVVQTPPLYALFFSSFRTVPDAHS
jgi:hypothetical protein